MPGLPEGVLNVVSGPGSVVGERLVAHPDVAKVAFTGSTEVGRSIAAGAAQTIKRVTLELGGKSASLIFADADLEAAAAAAPSGVFGNAGQDCCARSRILVERSAMDRFMELLEPSVGALRVGDPLRDGTEMGPLISADHRDKVASYLDDAPVAFRGSAPDGPGFWFPPTVLARSQQRRSRRPRGDLRSGRLRDPLRRRGRCGADRERLDLWTLGFDLDHRLEPGALRVARAIDTGVLSVNSNTSVRVTTPFGGFKQSGYGRELGPDALDAYTEVKNVYYATG